MRRRALARKLARAPVRLHDNTWLTTNPSAATPKTALVLLNTPPRPASALRQLWRLSSYRVCADAAANRLRESIHLAMGDEGVASGGPAKLQQRLRRLQDVAKQHDSMVPDVVTGDFDSIQAEVLEFYRQRGCLIAHDPSPDTTDFQKALRFVQQADANAGAASLGVEAGSSHTDGGGSSSSGGSRSSSGDLWTVIAFGAFGDRFDHELAAINVLYQPRPQFDR